MLPPNNLTAKTLKAVELVDQGMSIYKAAKEARISYSTLYRALSRHRSRTISRCPHCQRPYRNRVETETPEGGP